MLEEFTKRKKLRLLTSTAGFTEGIAFARRANQQDRTAHLLNERLVYSFLAYRSRKGLTASLRLICRETTLHPTTAKQAIDNLVGLVFKGKSGWSAVEPPEGWFRRHVPKHPVEHWSDTISYTALLLPRRGAKIVCEDKTKRFGLNHAVIFSFLLSRARKTNAVLRRFTCAGQAAMLGLNPKTVASVVADLESLGLIEKDDLGSCCDITLLPVKEHHLELFEPVAEKKKRAVADKLPKPTAKPEPTAYVLTGGSFDPWRRLCMGLMPQSYAEEAIKMARRLDDDYHAFEQELKAARTQHEKNKVSGKVGVGNFGAYFNKRYQGRVDALEDQERAEKREQQLKQHLESPEYKAKKAEEEKAAAADPMHPMFLVNTDAITDRVRFSDNALENFHAARKIESQVSDHISRYLETQGLDTQAYIDALGNDRWETWRRTLKKLNRYYQQPVLATPGQLQAALDATFQEHQPPFGPLFSEPKLDQAVTHA